MTVIYEKERTVWRPNKGMFENVASPNPMCYVDSIPKNLAKNRNQHSFVVEWQMTNEREIPIKENILKSY
jgi:hypothetical protein